MSFSQLKQLIDCLIDWFVIQEQFVQYFRLQFRFSLCPGDSTKPIPGLDALYKYFQWKSRNFLSKINEITIWYVGTLCRIVNKELNDNPHYLQSSPTTGFGRMKNSGSMTMNVEYRLSYLAFIFLDLAADTFKRVGFSFQFDNEISFLFFQITSYNWW